jgi:hypothetical protein
MSRWMFVFRVACLSVVVSAGASYWAVREANASQQKSQLLLSAHPLTPERLQRVNFYLDQMIAEFPNDLFHSETRAFLTSLRHNVEPKERYRTFLQFSEGFPAYGTRSLEFAPHFVELAFQANQEIHSPRGL